MTLLEALASTLRKDGDGNIYFNVICYSNTCQNEVSPFTCGNGEAADLEAFIVANGFGVDSCGNLALKMKVCDAADIQNPR